MPPFYRCRPSKNGVPKYGNGFTLIELLASLTIVALLVALGAGGISAWTAAAQRAKCLNNLRQIGLAAAAYSSDNNQFLVPPRFWKTFDEQGYLSKDSPVWICPADQRTNKIVAGVGPISYGFNTKLVGLPPIYHEQSKTKMVTHSHPSKLVYFCDATAYWVDQGNPNAAFRHQGKINALFLDGHVETLSDSAETFYTNGGF